MKALRLYGPKDMRVDDIPVPEINDNELLIKIDSCTICGSDFRNISAGGSAHGMDLPRVMGHEIASTIVKVGESWKDEFEVGEHIVVAAVSPCGKCELCLEGYENQCLDKQATAYNYDGGFAEYMRVPERSIRSGNVLKVSSDKLQQVALSEPLSCAINGQEIAEVKLGDSVLVVGCGPMGLFHIQLAKLNGAKQIIASDFDKNRLEIAKQHGADIVFSPQEEDPAEKIKELTGGLGVNVVIVAVPVPGIVSDALQWVRRRGRINVFGGMPKQKPEATLDLNAVHYNEITITGTSDSTARQLRIAADLITTGRIQTDFMISKVVDLEEARDILVAGPQPEHIKIVVKPELSSKASREKEDTAYVK
ncbi:zinc-binding dehydrogenase [Oceanobacillus sojae]|uniref:zinc-binding dehydrogenase n=1 Tax=Oceanobacillus sojae TaxID=582851 RepID=UPI0021A4999D|nr:alcohol dehydrogenase catalytic domain-containing protein [Oceanobacillus sojae]MCT1904052.1 alcohol dehydrogenase catalytic domain-containing protein [Oceanobacillus sojae]